MLQLTTTFDVNRDVVPGLLSKEDTVRSCRENVLVADTQILNVERDEGVVYCWRGATGNTRIGKYDPHTKQNKLIALSKLTLEHGSKFLMPRMQGQSKAQSKEEKNIFSLLSLWETLLYTFDKQVCINSCSLNKEETLLVVSLTRSVQGGEDHFKPVSKYLTLLIEIHPINNTKVIKAVDCKVKVQFLYPHLAKSAEALESHLLVAVEDGYIDQYHIQLRRQEGYKVVISEHLVKYRVTDEFCWVQWDSDTQRLFFLTSREKYVLKCVQFYSDGSFETLFELPLELPSNPFTSVTFINFGYDHYQERESEGMKLRVFTERTGIMCVCYSHPQCGVEDYTYTIAFVHSGFSKTFTVALEPAILPGSMPKLLPIFIFLGHYVVVYLPGNFLHLINCRQQDLLCHSLFLSGADAHIDPLGVNSGLMSVSSYRLLDGWMGRIYTISLSHDFLLQLLSPNRPEAQRLASLHCLLVHIGPDQDLEKKIIYWISENMMSFSAFDQIQEFFLGSLYKTCCHQSLSLNKVLPYSSVFEKKELPVALTAIPGVKCTPELLTQPVIKRKARSLQGYWNELQWIIERTKYFETVPNPRYRFSQIKSDWTKLQAALNSEKKKSSNCLQLEENTKKVLSMVDTWQLDKRAVPLFQEVDQPQRALVGLTVDKLRGHLNKHLPQLGKKKIENLVVNYMAKLLELIRHMLETLWLKLDLGRTVLCLKQQGSSEEWTIFHTMCRILEAAEGLCLPLPPGYATLLSMLGVRCLPRHTFLLYVDHGILQLTESFVSLLMTDLDNSNSSEELKFSVLKRLPERLATRVCQLLDHPVSSACITRQCVRRLLEKYIKTKASIQLDREKLCSRPEFLPLTYLVAILSDMEEQATTPFEEQEKVDASFVEEIALKQTLIKLGFEGK